MPVTSKPRKDNITQAAGKDCMSLGKTGNNKRSPLPKKYLTSKQTTRYYILVSTYLIDLSIKIIG